MIFIKVIILWDLDMNSVIYLKAWTFSLSCIMKSLKKKIQASKNILETRENNFIEIGRVTVVRIGKTLIIS